MTGAIDLVVAGGHVFVNGRIEALDVAVAEGKTIGIGPPGKFNSQGRETIDARGLHVLPGVIDSHVHFREPGKEDREDFESGTRSAVLGGVTCVFDMPNTLPSVTNQAALSDKLARIEGRAWCDFGLYIGADGANTTQLPELEQERGVCGIKVFMSSSTTDLMVTSESDLKAVMETGSRIVSLHAEDDDRINARRYIAEQAANVLVHGEWRDVESAYRATERAIRLARRARRRIHVLHVSSGREMELIAQNKDLVSCEVLPQHLTFHAPECYTQLGAKAQQNPPIREEADQNALWQAIADGTVDVVGSDHGPHTLADKAQPYPNMAAGMPGTQTLVPLMLDYVAQGRISLARLVDLVCTGPARVFGIEGKGAIAIGNDADFTLVDLKARRTITNDWIASKVGWTAYDGRPVTGWPAGTIVRGHCVMFEGDLRGRQSGEVVKFSAVQAHAQV
jgi:dihydroorotase